MHAGMFHCFVSRLELNSYIDIQPENLLMSKNAFLGKQVLDRYVKRSNIYGPKTIHQDKCGAVLPSLQ